MNTQVQQATDGQTVQADGQMSRLIALAEKLDCFTESDLMLLGKLSHSTVEAWRKRGQGPAYILLGNRYLYPRQAVAEHLASLTRTRTSLGKEAIL